MTLFNLFSVEEYFIIKTYSEKERLTGWDLNPQPLDWDSGEWTTTPWHLYKSSGTHLSSSLGCYHPFWTRVLVGQAPGSVDTYRARRINRSSVLAKSRISSVSIHSCNRPVLHYPPKPMPSLLHEKKHQNIK